MLTAAPGELARGLLGAKAIGERALNEPFVGRQEAPLGQIGCGLISVQLRGLEGCACSWLGSVLYKRQHPQLHQVLLPHPIAP